MQYTKDELSALLELDHKWSVGEAGGKRANLNGANLNGANLRYADLRYADLRYANLRGANLNGANLNGANLRYANLSGANLNGVDLNGANLNGANLNYANLNYANLSGVDLNGANLNGANLNGANLNGANLRYADLRYADLRYANLRGANLRYANLNGAIWDADVAADVVPSLQRARALIAVERNWIKGALKKHIADAENDFAYCSLGSVREADGTGEALATMFLQQAMLGDIAFFNDAPHRVHADILAAFDRAIAQATVFVAEYQIAHPAVTR